jgi:hypothetical protein
MSVRDQDRDRVLIGSYLVTSLVVNIRPRSSYFQPSCPSGLASGRARSRATPSPPTTRMRDRRRCHLAQRRRRKRRKKTKRKKRRNRCKYVYKQEKRTL